MHAISTAAFISVLALASTLAQAMPQGMAVAIAGAEPAPSPDFSPPSHKVAPCKDTYTVPEAESCDTLFAKLDLSKADILSLNSGLSCDDTIPAGKILCIKEEKHESPVEKVALTWGKTDPA
ncbi:hypothetical protein EDB83DRAFT_2317891 [Lactarius deliciosus]|nr:hypothetical protein EDB83DRAFT_2317891 [Lactarius deliciosus]